MHDSSPIHPHAADGLSLLRFFKPNLSCLSANNTSSLLCGSEDSWPSQVPTQMPGMCKWHALHFFFAHPKTLKICAFVNFCILTFWGEMPHFHLLLCVHFFEIFLGLHREIDHPPAIGSCMLHIWDHCASKAAA